jgi:hypothetical protein
MVAPVAIAAGKKAAPVARAVARKATDNPAGSMFLLVLVGAVVLQGVKNLPNFGEWAWNKVIPFDVTAPFDYTKEAIEITAAYNDEVITGFENISANRQDPIENWIFGTGWDARAYDDLSVEVYEPGEMSAVRKAYVGARGGLFTGLFNRGWFY